MKALENCCLYDSIDIRYHHYLDKLMFLPCCNKLGPEKATVYDYFVDEKIITENRLWDAITIYYDNADNLLKYPCTESCFKLQLQKYKEGYYCKFNKTKLKNIHFNMSTSCNLHCDMCRSCVQINKHKDDLYFKALEQLKGHNLEMLEFTSLGEPFLYKDKLFSYIDSLKNTDFKLLKFVSNLTLLDKEDIEHLNKIKKEKNINILFSVSIDGITEETYKKIRHNDCFNKIIENTLLLHKYSLLEFVNFVIQEKNKHELMKAYEFWRSKGINFQSIIVNWSQLNESLEAEHPEYYEVYNIFKSKEYREYFLKRQKDEKANSMFYWDLSQKGV